MYMIVLCFLYLFSGTLDHSFLEVIRLAFVVGLVCMSYSTQDRQTNDDCITETWNV